MLVLYETSAGYSLFKVNDNKKYASLNVDDIYESMFHDAANAKENIQLISFQPFQDTADAVAAITACQEGKVSSSLQQFLTKRIKKILKKSSSDSSTLAIADKSLAVNIKQDILSTLSSKDSKMKVVNDDKTAEIFRGIRCYMDDLLNDTTSESDTTTSIGLSSTDIHKMQLGLSHSLGRYKLKFSADKVDTMIIQAVGLLDELDKEINTYAMRVKEWYGWHFPELQAIASDNATYAKVVLAAGHRHKLKDTDLSLIYGGDHDESTQIEINAIKEAAEISMGTDITDHDVLNIQSLAEQVISMTEYRLQLYEYLRNRMNAIAPNLTILTGELVGARLIAHAGSLINLAKQPASTVQILGAEKALFRALKTKHDTPKYGLIYHASLIGQAAPKHKGKISRVLAAKASLAIRVDALSDDTAAGDEIDTTVGYEGRAKVEARLRQLDGGTHLSGAVTKNGTNLKAQKTAKYDPVVAKVGAANVSYNTSSDIMHLDTTTNDDNNNNNNNENGTKNEESAKKKEKKAKKEKKRKKEEDDNENEKAAEEIVAQPVVNESLESPPPKKKRKEADDEDNNGTEKKKKSEKKSDKKAKKEKRKSQD